MQVVNRNRDAQPFTTRDGSTIRELMHTEAQSLAEATLAPGQAIQRHYHRASEELYYLLEGSGELEIDGETRDVAAGDAVLIPPGGADPVAGERSLRPRGAGRGAAGGEGAFGSERRERRRGRLRLGAAGGRDLRRCEGEGCAAPRPVAAAARARLGCPAPRSAAGSSEARQGSGSLSPRPAARGGRTRSGGPACPCGAGRASGAKRDRSRAPLGSPPRRV